MRRIAARPPQQSVAQRGQALLILLMILGIGFGAWFYTFAGRSDSTVERDAITTEVLAKAKEALIGNSVSNANRPGALPCPDTDNDGVAELAATNCPSNIGRLPWKTLGLPDLRDSSGERLWYVLSANFRDNAAAEPINSDTKGSLTVYVGSSSAVQTNEAVAVIFAPGAAIGNNIRDVAGENNPANYLETASGINNASAAGPYIAASTTDTFNDRLLVITTADLMTPVEQRVAHEILTILQAYRNAAGNWCNCYPYADVSNGESDNGQLYGRVPLNDARPPSSAVTPDWSDVNITTATYPALAWLRTNNWRWVFFYSIAPAVSASPSVTSVCSSWPPAAYLMLDGKCGTSVVLISTGPAGIGRPITSWGGDSDWQYYVDDSVNRDGGTSFTTPSSTAYARDRIYTIP